MAAIRLSLFSIGETAGFDREIEGLLSELAVAPNSRIRGVLVEALSQKALVAIASGDPSFATYLETGRRSLDASQLLALALTSERLRPAVLASEDAIAAFRESLDYSARFPSTRSTNDWIISQHVAPEAAAEIKAAALANKSEAAAMRIAYDTAPWSVSAVVGFHLWLLLTGEDAEAARLLEKARAENVPIPVL
jgi:hypothetical protein